MVFKTRPHRYSIGPAPSNRARCRGCRQLIGRGEPRLAIHAFVKPGRGTVFARHLTSECIGPALAADVMRVRTGDVTGMTERWRRLISETVALERSGEGRNVKHKVGAPNQRIISSMFGDLSGRQLSRAQQKEDAVGEEPRVWASDVWDSGTGVDGTGLESKSRSVGLAEAGTALDGAV